MRCVDCAQELARQPVLKGPLDDAMWPQEHNDYWTQMYESDRKSLRKARQAVCVFKGRSLCASHYGTRQRYERQARYSDARRNTL